MPAKRRVKLREVLTTLPVGWMLGRRDMKIKYKQSALGPLWLVLQPLGDADRNHGRILGRDHREHRRRPVRRLRPGGAGGLDLRSVHLHDRPDHAALEPAGRSPQPLSAGRPRHRHPDLGSPARWAWCSSPASAPPRSPATSPSRRYWSAGHDRLAARLHVGRDAPRRSARRALSGCRGLRPARGAGRDLPDAGRLSAQHRSAEGPRTSSPSIRCPGLLEAWRWSLLGISPDMLAVVLALASRSSSSWFGWYVFGRMETRFADYV